MNNGTGYVYAIRAVTIGRIKIGYSADPEVRLCNMQVGSPDVLEIIATWPGTEEQERKLHKHLNQWRLHGEWFEASEVVLDTIKHCDAQQKTDLNRSNSEVGLSILQAGFDQALDEGLVAKLGLFGAKEGLGLPRRIIIEIWNATICPSCRVWTEQANCPACGSQIG